MTQQSRGIGSLGASPLGAAAVAEPGLAPARVILFTDRHTMLAEIQTGRSRLSDVVNDPLRNHLFVEHVRINRLDRLDETIATFDRTTVRRDCLQALLVMSEPPRPAHQRLASYVPKTPVKVGILMSTFLIEGTVHVPGKADPVSHVMSGPEGFTAVIDATVTLIQRVGAPLKVPTALINREHITLVTVSQESERAVG